MSRTLMGQQRLMMEISRLSSTPPFIILEGPKGQGKRTFAKWYSEYVNIPLIEVGNKIADIRDIIENSKSLSSPYIYFIHDGDTMSVGAKNSLLKITEEPPKNLIIMMCLTHIDNTLGTIRSRARLWTLDGYSLSELGEYLSKNYGSDVDYIDDILSIGTNPGEINELMAIGFGTFIEYVDKVVANIGSVSTGNSFKIADKMDFKGTGEGYDIAMFLKVFMKVCRDMVVEDIKDGKTTEDISQLVNWMRVTNQALAELAIRGVSKKAVFDIWILNIRRYR